MKEMFRGLKIMNKNYSELIEMPEGKTLEFKRDISSPEKIIKTLTAFSNTAGGILIIGVEDKTKKISVRGYHAYAIV